MPVRGDDGELAVAEHAWENHHPIHCSGVGTNFGLGGGGGPRCIGRGGVRVI